VAAAAVVSTIAVRSALSETIPQPQRACLRLGPGADVAAALRRAPASGICLKPGTSPRLWARIAAGRRLLVRARHQACHGVQLHPGVDVAALVRARPPRTTFCFGPGLYRLDSTVNPRRGDTLWGAPGAILSGARPLGHWTRTAAGWSTHLNRLVPTLNKGAPGDRLAYPQARYDEDVYLDGRQLWKAGVRHGGRLVGSGPGSLRPGEYFVDYDRDTILLGSDPVGRNVELTTVRDAIRGDAPGVTVRGLTVQMAAGTGIRAFGPWTIERNRLRLNAESGVTVLDGARVLGNLIARNGVYGITGHGAGILVLANDVAWNDTSRLETEAGACNADGGSKFSETEDLVVARNDFHDNLCNGLWLDIRNVYSLVVGNRSVGNRGSGFVHEISYHGTFLRNTAVGNEEFGLVVRGSSGDLIARNRLGPDGEGPLLLIDVRRSDHASPLGPHLVRNTIVRRNDFVLGRGRQRRVGGVDFEGGDLFESGNRFRANTYHLPWGGARSFVWRDGRTSARGWRRLGNDRDGRFLVARGG
jgi:hypothetical protein